MKIIIAPDSFKGSLAAPDVCRAVKKGVLAVFPGADVTELPLADGGEGTMESMVRASGGQFIQREVRGPLGEPVRAAFGVLGDGETAVIEMAQASGLTLVADGERNPLTASSFGTGELIQAALDLGYRKFIVGIGGSATNDAGTGMLKALGMRFFDSRGAELGEGGGDLGRLAHIDGSGFDERIAEADFLVASDVRNPLCGPDGASAVFGPQKGATPEMVRVLDAALHHFAEVTHRQTGKELRAYPGGGAAGGMGAALIAFLDAELRPGIGLVLESLDFAAEIRDADLIITGEGRLDAQTLEGKVVAGVAEAARSSGVPVIALAGSQNLSFAQLRQIDLLSAFSIVSGPCSVEMAMEQAEQLLTEKASMVLSVMRPGLLSAPPDA
ncbi:glycerate kinase [Indiicoccus explosivorum]|uniref:glycerate kinase n=1 Tax=Indiicoccus explosivorum TaxID=1917864 RepID=UPI000B44770D|nr:glycerate kinase [Indiicoccus explosivorum]